MAKIEPMDILRDTTPEEHKMLKILSWASNASRQDKDGYVHIVFKKNTPEKILRAYQQNLNLMLFKTKGDYTIEK